MVAVPNDTPLTRPDALTVATPGFPELHVPPVTASVSAVVPVLHIDVPPVIVPADPAVTVTM